MTMAAETDNRSARPFQRQAGFNVVGADAKMSGVDGSRIRTTTGDTVIRGSFDDDDIEMGDEKRTAVVPVAIPRSLQDSAELVEGQSKVASGSQTRAGVAEAIDAKLPSLHGNLLSPRLTTISSSHVSSGPASLSSAQWSPGRSSDPHLYSISGQPYSNASVRPYLSTSFKMSAERGAGLSTTEPRGGADLEDDDDDDIFAQSSSRRRGPNEPSPPHLRRSNDVDREEGDAAGVFSFSSPYFGPRSLDASDVPPLSPPPDGQSVSSSRHYSASQRLMSPSWTAASLGKLSLGGPAETSAGSAQRAPLGSSPHQSTGSASSSLYSRSLPSGAPLIPSSAQARRSSFNRRARPGPGFLHPYNQPSPRSRSTSRHRGAERPERVMENVYDDDETDDEVMATQDDDDATEDEADTPNRARYSAGQAASHYGGAGRSGEEGGTYAAMAIHRHSSGQQTTMSASYERAHSGLSRQYSSDRYAHHALSRHHPYALSPTSASPNNGGVGISSYSPSNPRGPLGRRRSSFNNGNVLSGSPSNPMMQALSQSPRYMQSIPTRDRPPIGLNGEPTGSYAGSYPKQGYVNATYAYGESPDAGNTYRGGRYGVRELDEDEEDDREEDDGDRSRRAATRHSKPAARSTSASRAANAANAGEVESEEMVEVNAIRERLGGAANCSAFISKLWYLMCRPELYQRYIHWSESGDSVILSNDPDINNEFAAEVLPKLFKHGNNASFVRQLNLYGFQRVPSSRLLDAAEIKAARRFANGANISTALQLYGPHSSFAHPRFKKDQESLLPSMKPRSSKKTKKVNGADDSGTKAGGAESEGEEEFAM